MKTTLTLLKLTILLCCTFATTAAFGQTLIWTNALMGSPYGNEIGVSTNWSGPAGPGSNLPTGNTTLEFNGTVPGPLVLYHDLGNIDNNGGLGPVGGGPGSSGTSFYINASQTSPVTISGRVAPVGGNMGLNNITIDSGAGQFTLGDNTQNALLFTARPAGAIHDFINNSTNPVIICPNVAWQSGGGARFTFEFDSSVPTPGSGIGDFGITNSLGTSDVAPAVWFVSGGTITWTSYSIPNDNVAPGQHVASPIIISAGTTLILKTNSCLGNQNITNNGATPSSLIYDGNSPQTLGGVISGPISLTVKSGALTLSGANTYTGGTTIAGGALQVSTNGTLGTGNLQVNTMFVFNRSNNLTFGGNISGTGTVVQAGAGGVTLTGAIIITGPTTVSNGTVVITGGGVSGDMNVSGGTLVPSAVGAIGTLNVASNLNINSGTVLIMVNKSLSPSNNVVIVTNGTITAQPGTVLKLANYGPPFQPGDRFYIFQNGGGVVKAVGGGGSMTIQAPGVTSFINNLAFDGSVTVQTVTGTPLAFTSAVQSGGNVNLMWPAAWTGVHLQSQTNTLKVGLTTNWVTIPGTDTGNSYSAPLVTTNPAVFYRLAP